MELYQIRTFITVSDEGNLTRAANRLNTSQPSVSAHIKALEEELGVSLFERTPKGMTLTKEGASLKESADCIAHAVDELESNARRLRNKLMGDLSIGLNSDPVFLKTGELFSRMHTQYPCLNLNLGQSTSGKILLDIKARNLDGGYFFGDNDYNEIESFVLKSVNLVIIGPYLWKDRIEAAGWKEVSEIPWIGNSSHCPFNKLIKELFIERDLTPTIAHIAREESTIKSLVMANAGMTFMLEEDARIAAEKNELAIWPGERIKWLLNFAYLKKRQNDPLVKALVATIREMWLSL